MMIATGRSVINKGKYDIDYSALVVKKPGHAYRKDQIESYSNYNNSPGWICPLFVGHLAKRVKSIREAYPLEAWWHRGGHDFPKYQKLGLRVSFSNGIITSLESAGLY